MPRMGRHPQLCDPHCAGDSHEEAADHGCDEEGNTKRQRAYKAEILNLHRILILQNENNQKAQKHKCRHCGCPDNTCSGDGRGVRVVIIPGGSGFDRRWPCGPRGDGCSRCLWIGLHLATCPLRAASAPMFPEPDAIWGAEHRVLMLLQ
jgi:hypothetical protein